MASGSASEVVFTGDQHRVASNVLLGFTVCQSLLTTGIIYGWPALLLILRAEGVFKTHCQDGISDCDARTVSFNFVFAVGSVVGVAGSFPNGRLVDMLGPKRAMMLGIAVTSCASLIFALAPADSDLAWPCAFAAYGLGGMLVHLASFSLGNAFGSCKTLVISCLVGTFSLSSMTFQVMQSAYTGTGGDRQTIFLVHAAVEIVFFFCSLWLWPFRPIQRDDKLVMLRCRLKLQGNHAMERSEGKCDQESACAFSTVFSYGFVGFTVFHSVQLWISRCMMGWIEAVLLWKNEELVKQGSQPMDMHVHLSMFNACQSFAGLLAIPVFGWLVAKRGHQVAPFLATNALAAIWLIFVLVPGTQMLVPFYIVSGLHRQVFFSTFFTYVATEFPVQHFGTLSGTASVVAGVLAYTQNPILDFALTEINGHFTIPLAVQLGVVIMCFALPYANLRRTQKHLAQMSNNSSEDQAAV